MVILAIWLSDTGNSVSPFNGTVQAAKTGGARARGMPCLSRILIHIIYESFKMELEGGIRVSIRVLLIIPPHLTPSSPMTHPPAHFTTPLNPHNPITAIPIPASKPLTIPPRHHHKHHHHQQNQQIPRPLQHSSRNEALR